MTFKLSGLAAAIFVFVASLVSSASAATVDARNAVAFEFDFSTTDSTSFNRFGYNCGSCSGEGLFLSGATMQLDFGTTLGGSEIGTRTFTNPFNFAISNVSSGLTPEVAVPGSVNTLFMTFRYVDDAFEISSANIYGQSTGVMTGTLVGTVPPAPVPRPAGIFLMVSALGGFAFMKRK